MALHLGKAKNITISRQSVFVLPLFHGLCIYIYTYDYIQSAVVLSAYVLTRRTGMYGACCKCRKYWPGRMFRDFSALRIGVSEPCFRGPAPVPESVTLGLKLAF